MLYVTFITFYLSVIYPWMHPNAYMKNNDTES